MTSTSSSPSSTTPPIHNHNTTQHTHNIKKTKAEITEVKRKAISLLTTAYKTESDEQVQELEAQLKDLLLMIRPEDLQAATTRNEPDTTASYNINDDPSRLKSVPPPAASNSPASGVLLRDFNGTKHDPLKAHIGEIKKPMKQFHSRSDTTEILLKKGAVAGMQQEALLEAAMGRKARENGSWRGYLFGLNEDGEDEDASEVGFKEFGEMGGKGLRKHKTRRRGHKRPSAGNISDAFAGMTIVTTKKQTGTGTNKSTSSSISSNSFDSEDDVSTLGTEPTYESSSISERMTGFLRVRRLPTTAEEDEGGGETTNNDRGGEQHTVLQDIAEEEASASGTVVETPIWRRGWFQPRPQEVPT